MKIVQLVTENVKRIVLVQITPGANGMVVVGGDNGQGKTSLLDSIAMAIGGGKDIPAQPIRQGASKGSIVLETDTFTITRTFNKSGSQLVVKNAEGVPMPSPQKLLDDLTNRVSFDPLAFTRMDSGEQTSTLQRLVGLDLSALDNEYAAKYSERTTLNRDAKQQTARVDGMQRHAGAPKEFVTTDAIVTRLEEANQLNRKNEFKRNDLKSAQGGKDLAASDLESAKVELERAQARVTHSEANLQSAVEILATVENEVAALVDVEIAPIAAEMSEVESTNIKIRENADWQRENEKLVALTRKATALTDRLAAIEGEKDAALAKTKFPIEGLAFSPDGVTFQGVPFSQASAAEQLRVSVAMGMSMNPRLRVLLVRDGSLLDDKSMNLLTDLVKENDFQLWIEKVGDGKDVTVVIEDGHVKEDRTQQSKK